MTFRLISFSTFFVPTKAVLVFAFVMAAAAPCLQSQTFDKSTVLPASNFLTPDWLRSEIHEVAPEVRIDQGLAVFAIRSTYGSEEIYGSDLVRKRIREIHATATLKEKGTVGAAVSGVVDESLDTARNLGSALKRPVRTIFNIPKGVGSLVKGSTGSMDNSLKAGGNYTGGPVRAWFDIGEVKLELAAELGVDPYSEFEPLQKEFQRLASASTTTGLGIRLIVPGDGIIGAAAKGESARQLNDVYLTPPTQLFRENVEMLTALGVPKERSSLFLGTAIYSPADQSLVVRAAAAFGKPSGIVPFLDLAESAANRTESFLFRRSMDLLLRHHQSGNSITGLTGFSGYPAGVTSASRFVVPLYLDHISWTERAPEIVAALIVAQKAAGCSGTDLLFPGTITDRAASALKGHNIRVIPMTRS